MTWEEDVARQLAHKRAQRRAAEEQRAAADAEYRRQVTGSTDKPLPGLIGQQSSAGAARGGRGSSKIGKGRHA